MSTRVRLSLNCCACQKLVKSHNPKHTLNHVRRALACRPAEGDVPPQSSFTQNFAWWVAAVLTSRNILTRTAQELQGIIRLGGTSQHTVVQAGSSQMAPAFDKLVRHPICFNLPRPLHAPKFRPHADVTHLCDSKCRLRVLVQQCPPVSNDLVAIANATSSSQSRVFGPVQLAIINANHSSMPAQRPYGMLAKTACKLLRYTSLASRRARGHAICKEILLDSLLRCPAPRRYSMSKRLTQLLTQLSIRWARLRPLVGEVLSKHHVTLRR